VDDDIEYRLVHPEDLSFITQIEAMEEWLEGSVEHRLRKGAVCLVAMEGPSVAGFNLVSIGSVSIPLISFDRSFGDRSAWSEQITVSSNYRGRGIAQTLRFKMFSELKSRGVERFYGGALSFNTASLNLARKVGFSVIVEVDYRKFFHFVTRRYRRLRP
jgi:RimJ/RimL family protein N-acetyltransferase